MIQSHVLYMYVYIQVHVLHVPFAVINLYFTLNVFQQPHCVHGQEIRQLLHV